MTDQDDRYLTLADLVAYSGLSLRTINRYLAATDAPLPHYRIGGRILVKKSEFDQWVTRVGTTAEQRRAKAYDAKLADAVATVTRHSRH
jgi:excisionase family DNA binding protein